MLGKLTIQNALTAMKDASEIKSFLNKALVESYLHEYKEVVGHWSSLEIKAQSSIVVVGIFIAGAFGFITKADPPLSSVEKFFLVPAILCLIVSVICSVWVLKLREISPPPLGVEGERLFNDILSIDDKDLTGTHLRNFTRDYGKAWKETKEKLDCVNREKSKLLKYAQALLIVAIFLIATAALAKIFIA
jgi:hypothetical protein